MKNNVENILAIFAMDINSKKFIEAWINDLDSGREEEVFLYSRDEYDIFKEHAERKPAGLYYCREVRYDSDGAFFCWAIGLESRYVHQLTPSGAPSQRKVLPRRKWVSEYEEGGAK